MTKANHKARAPVTEQFVTVQESQRYREWTSGNPKPATFYPWLKPAGRWIEQAGFTPGQRLRISVEHGRLVITTA